MRETGTRTLPLFLIAGVIAGGFSHRDDVPAVVSAREQIRPDAPSPVALALQQIVAGNRPASVNAAVWTDVREFYARREGASAWQTDTSRSNAGTALEVLSTAPDHGFASADYGGPELGRRRIEPPMPSGKDAPGPQEIAALDARITTALLALGRDVALGRTRPEQIDRRWQARREPPDLVGTLMLALDGDVKTWLSSIRPQHPEYAVLQLALGDLLRQRENGGWPTIPAGTFKPGQSTPSVVVLRQRLAASGQVTGPAAADASPLYDHNIETGVHLFQNLHGLKATGIADAPTVAALNVPIGDRIVQIKLNLERWRWMPDDFGPRHLLVNIPSYHVVARENGKTVLEMRVIVGKRDNHKTPIFSSQMSTVVFSPYWNIPASIVKSETMPAIARDSEYLSRSDIEILRVSKTGAASVDPSSVNWNDPQEVRQLAFRQRPGPRNALGNVKFLFPNEFEVYLHDTPNDNFFERTMRALSHGCVRLEEPELLANYILRGYPEWDGQRIADAMHAGVEKHVKLNEAIPVHMVYFTSWIDDAGGLHFHPDVYGYDAKQVAQAAAVL
jgi:murein L,D-transpeptidase YcbB/YkuD